MLKKLITISITAIASLQAATTYDKSLTDGNDALNYWSDTTDTNLNNHTLSGATEVFTIGSRKNIPNITTPIKVSTNKLCSNDRTNILSCSKTDSLEPRYTENGNVNEPNLRLWHNAATPRSVNGVVDEPCSELDNTGSVVNWWVNFPSLRCERTITTYTPKVNSTIYTNKVNSDIFTNKVPSITTTGGVNIYADKVDSIVYANKISGSSSYSATLVNSYSWWTSGYYWAATQYQIYQAPQGYTSYTATWELSGSNTATEYSGNNSGCYSRYYLPMASTYVYSYYSLNQSLTRYMTGTPRPQTRVTLTCKIKNSSYTCPSGGTLSGATCITPTLTCPSGYLDNVTNCKKTVKVCPDASWSDNGANCTKVTPIVSVTNYYCPATYSDMGTYCKKTIQICPDPSWTSATATTCSKVIQICPDASWTDNGTNCKKNVPEYKLFSTF